MSLNSNDWIDLLANIIFDRMSGMVFRCSANDSRSIQFASSDMTELLGSQSETINLLDITHPDDRDYVIACVTRTITAREPYAITYRLQTNTGEIRRVCELGSPIFDDGQVSHIEGVLTDVRPATVDESVTDHEHHRSLIAALTSNQGLWDWTPATNHVYYSTHWKHQLGLEDSPISDDLTEWISRIHPDDRDETKAKLDKFIEVHEEQFEDEHRIKHRDGSYRWMRCRAVAVHDQEGRMYRISGFLSDITHQKQAAQALKDAAVKDTLTGLPNRTLFIERVAHAVAHIPRKKQCFAVMCLDLDRFKTINDSLGPLAADQILIAVGKRISEALRPEDTIARLGGDEFGILLDSVDMPDKAEIVARRVMNACTAPIRLNGENLFTSASIGIALADSPTVSPEDLLRDADTALYHAKDQNRGTYALFSQEMHSRAVSRMQIENDLRHAVESGQFQVNYQPIIGLGSGNISGFEALVRWIHPERGMISPVDFIPVAEETGMIIPIGKWVLENACEQLRRWQDEFSGPGRLTMAVNCSGKQFADHNLIDDIMHVIKDMKLEPQDLKIEVTESVMMENAESAAEMLEELRSRRVQVAIDDFGTGYSSLGYLQQLPIDSLKIDRSFLMDPKGTQRRGKKEDIIEAISTLAHNLGMSVVAEGVENTELLGLLRNLGCEYGQGYFFSKPVDHQTATSMLTNNPAW